MVWRPTQCVGPVRRAHRRTPHPVQVVAASYHVVGQRQTLVDYDADCSASHVGFRKEHSCAELVIVRSSPSPVQAAGAGIAGLFGADRTRTSLRFGSARASIWSVEEFHSPLPSRTSARREEPTSCAATWAGLRTRSAPASVCVRGFQLLRCCPAVLSRIVWNPCTALGVDKVQGGMWTRGS